MVTPVDGDPATWLPIRILGKGFYSRRWPWPGRKFDDSGRVVGEEAEDPHMWLAALGN